MKNWFLVPFFCIILQVTLPYSWMKLRFQVLYFVSETLNNAQAQVCKIPELMIFSKTQGPSTSSFFHAS